MKMLNSFTSLDGVQIDLTPDDLYLLDSLFYRMRSGYRNIIPLAGAPGYTELCMHVGCANRRGVVAFVNDDQTYAYVLFEDKSVVDGSFHHSLMGLGISVEIAMIDYGEYSIDARLLLDWLRARSTKLQEIREEETAGSDVWHQLGGGIGVLEMMAQSFEDYDPLAQEFWRKAK